MRGTTDGRTGGQTEGRYQVHYLLASQCYMVDKNPVLYAFLIETSVRVALVFPALIVKW